MQPAFTNRLPRASKRAAGRTAVAQVPAHIRAFGLKLDRDDRAAIRQQLGAKLGKYADAIERVSVRVSVLDGSRGGTDKRCRIKVVLPGLASVVFESRAAYVDDAINGAVTGTERVVRRSLERRHAQSLKRASTNSGQRHPDESSDKES